MEVGTIISRFAAEVSVIIRIRLIVGALPDRRVESAHEMI